ncbi:MAG: thiamine biosynthesis protein ThiS [Bacteroidetes bacterium QS_8_64_10]|nr:MAG: thiamine biosynthesis protein ThiS [Bacteroidetes bacterium QS_8_64_10]
MPADTEQTTITVNGEPASLPDDKTVASLLREQGRDPDEATGVAVAVNEEVVRRAEWPEIVLEEGDEVEIIGATQGG